MASRLDIARPDIVSIFASGSRVLHTADISRMLGNYRGFWRLAQHTNLRSFIEYLLAKTELRRVVLPFPQTPYTGYTWGNLSLLETLQGLINGHYSHYTAVRIHGLTEQVPKTIYVTTEKRSGSAGWSQHEGPFEQAAIDNAFSRPPRVSSNECVVDGMRVVHLSSAHHGGIGIMSTTLHLGEDRPIKVMVTAIERTLIDITVRPFYAGGVAEVAKAFELAKANQDLSVNRMAAMYESMAFGYPYHQAIGYYLERAGFRGPLLDIFRRLPQERDFYLTHQMGETEYIKPWRLFVPKGF